MWPDRVSIPGPLALESDAIPTALRSPVRYDIRKTGGETHKTPGSGQTEISVWPLTCLS